MKDSLWRICGNGLFYAMALIAGWLFSEAVVFICNLYGINPVWPMTVLTAMILVMYVNCKERV